MSKRVSLCIFVSFGLFSLPVTTATAQDAGLTAAVGRILEAHCTLCHAPPGPSADLDLSAGSFLTSTVNVPSRRRPEMRLVRPNDPDGSYLIHKLRGDEDIAGRRMPASGGPLSEDEMATIVAWIRSFPEAWGGTPADRGGMTVGGDAGSMSEAVAHDVLMDSRMALLPTPAPLQPGERRFDILHRFNVPLQNDNAGFESLYGLDFGANIAFQLGYGLLPGLEVGVRRSGARAHWELLAKYELVGAGGMGGRPVSAALFASHGATTRDGLANHDSWNGQLLVAIRPHDRVGLLLAPSYSTRTDPIDDANAEGTLALGVGAELRPLDDLALVLEAVPVLSGFETGDPAMTMGIKYRYGGHTFMLLVTNALEMNTDLYLPGGDLDFADAFRLGFNITRRISR